MQTRRSFIGKSLAATAIIFQFSPGVEAAQFELARLRKVIDVTGKPTPDYLIVGKTGDEHFRAIDSVKQTVRCWLDGVQVDCRASEVDAKGGWVRMFDVEPDGKTLKHLEIIHHGRLVRRFKMALHFPYRPPLYLDEAMVTPSLETKGEWVTVPEKTIATPEFIHFGDVRLEIM